MRETFTGMGGHQSAHAQSVTWLTPRFIIDALGPFDLDPCAAPAPRPWPTARRHITLPQDGLAACWDDARVYVNPPSGAEAWRWLYKLADHGHGTALVFARTETGGFFETVWDRASAVLFLRGRLTFHLPDGSLPPANGGAPSVLVAYGVDDADILHECARSGRLDGHFQPLTPFGHFVVFVQSVGSSADTWATLILQEARTQGGSVTIGSLWRALKDHPKAAGNNFVREQIRKVAPRVLAREAPGQYRLPFQGE